MLNMIEVLDDIVGILPDILKVREDWDSLIINRRKPHTYRVFSYVGNIRVCLHRFELCDEGEEFMHPHIWPAAFLVMASHYRQKVGESRDRYDKPHGLTMDMVLSPGSKYAIMNPRTWHSVQPVVVEGYEPPECVKALPRSAYSIMVNDVPWPEEIAHMSTRTTKGKDLDKMTEEELLQHLSIFKQLLGGK